ncbi:hypothetical protein [Sphingomonas sp. MMS24-J13]|uniref:hypothetical protein n=1 Tax=Sphingomonas sp. MMS24-J13 TaxID=3238686 RepID=UPI003850E1DF
MAILPPLARPSVVMRDLRIFMQGDRRHKLVFATLAVGVTSLLMTLMIIESWWGVKPEGQQIVYASDFAANRTDAQIIAQNKADQAELEKAKAERRRQFQKLDDSMTKMGF